MTIETAKVQPENIEGVKEAKSSSSEDIKAMERLAFVLNVTIGYTVTVKVRAKV